MTSTLEEIKNVTLGLSVDLLVAIDNLGVWSLIGTGRITDVQSMQAMT